MLDEMKACPFCGEQLSLDREGKFDTWFHPGSYCIVSDLSPIRADDENRIADWNRRAALPSGAEPVGCTCQGCQRQFIGDLLVPDEVWAKIAPNHVAGSKGGGLLCGGCIVDRIVGRNIATVVFAALSPVKGDGK